MLFQNLLLICTHPVLAAVGELRVGGWVSGEKSLCCEEFAICVGQDKPIK